MKLTQYCAIGAALFVMYSANIHAQTKSNPWLGAYAQIGIGYESYIPKSATGTTTFPGTPPLTNVGTANHANGPAAAIGVGYNFGLSDSYLIGVGASLYPGHSKSASSTMATNVGNSQIVNTGNYDVSNVFSFNLMPGYVIDKTHLVYAKVGYAGSTTNANSPGNYPQQSTKTNGTVYGLGYKQFISESIFVFGEGNYAVNRAKPVTILADNGATVTSTSNATGYDFIFGLGYHF
jgi:outer membrane immunogenic protein